MLGNGNSTARVAHTEEQEKKLFAHRQNECELDAVRQDGRGSIKNSDDGKNMQSSA